MTNFILEFLEAYKSLDELCKQIFNSEKGISTYIDEMENTFHGYNTIPCWKEDFLKLKNLRWVRNKLVHETSSFEHSLFSYDDILWLQTFRLRILKCTDPLALLHQSCIKSAKAYAKPHEQKTPASYSADNKNKTIAESRTYTSSQSNRPRRILKAATIILLAALVAVLILKSLIK